MRRGWSRSPSGRWGSREPGGGGGGGRGEDGIVVVVVVGGGAAWFGRGGVVSGLGGEGLGDVRPRVGVFHGSDCLGGKRGAGERY